MKKKEELKHTPQDVEFVTVDINDPKNTKIREALQASIFRPPPNENWFQRRLKKFMIDYLTKHDEPVRRFKTVHRIKLAFLHPLLKFIALKFGKYLVKGIEEVPEVWWNNHIRMFYHSFAYAGLKDMWMHMYYRQGYNKFKEKYPTQESFFEGFIYEEKGMGDKPPQYNLSHRHRKMLIDIWITEILEDSIDREWMNMSVMELTHTMMEYYGVSEVEMKKVPKPGEWPVYLSVTQNDPQYFMKNANIPVWQIPKEEKKDVNEEQAKGTGSQVH